MSGQMISPLFISCYLPSCLLLLLILYSCLTFFLAFSLFLPFHASFQSWYSLLGKYLWGIQGAGRPKLGGSAEERLQLLWISCLFCYNTTVCLPGFWYSPGKLRNQKSRFLEKCMSNAAHHC